MQNAEGLWREFLAFCGPQQPTDWLAVDFLIQRDGPQRSATSAWHSQRDLHVLQVLLTWRARNSSGEVTPSAFAAARREA